MVMHPEPERPVRLCYNISVALSGRVHFFLNHTLSRVAIHVLSLSGQVFAYFWQKIIPDSVRIWRIQVKVNLKIFSPDFTLNFSDILQPANHTISPFFSIIGIADFSSCGTPEFINKFFIFF